MRSGWIGAIFFIWVLAMFLGSVSAGTDLLQDENVTNPVNDIMSYATVYSTESWGTLIWPGTHEPFFRSFFHILTLNLPLFGPSNSPWQIVRWAILGPIIATVVFSLVILLLSILRR